MMYLQATIRPNTHEEMGTTIVISEDDKRERNERMQKWADEKLRQMEEKVEVNATILRNKGLNAEKRAYTSNQRALGNEASLLAYTAEERPQIESFEQKQKLDLKEKTQTLHMESLNQREQFILKNDLTRQDLTTIDNMPRLDPRRVRWAGLGYVKTHRKGRTKI